MAAEQPPLKPLSEPVRMCVGCRERAGRSVLLRVIAVQAGGTWSVVPDPQRRGLGRGASMHRSLGCLELAERRRAFTRALRLTAGPGARLDTTPVREYLIAQAYVQ